MRGHHSFDEPEGVPFLEDLQCRREARTEPGSSSLEAQDGAEAREQLGRTGTMGTWIAELMATSYEPEPPKIYGQWLVLSAMVERTAINDGNTQAAIQARQAMASVGGQLVARGLATLREAEYMQYSALQQAQAQVN